MKHLALLLLLVSVAIAALWVFSAFHPWQISFTRAGSSYHLSSEHAAAKFSWFSTTAEDPAYHQFRLPYWLAEAVTLPATAFAFVRFFRTRRQKSPGFPISSSP